jgi:prepilin-type N-terminal cleavage/methylation domain-containing protein
MKNSFLRSRKGFTLPELIVVVTILVILSGAAFVSYSNFTIDARDSARKSDMGSLKVALQSAKLKQ